MAIPKINNCFFHSYCTHFVIFLRFSLNVKNRSIRPSFTGEIGKHEPAYYWGKNIQGYWELKEIKGDVKNQMGFEPTPQMGFEQATH